MKTVEIMDVLMILDVCCDDIDRVTDVAAMELSMLTPVQHLRITGPVSAQLS